MKIEQEEFSKVDRSNSYFDLHFINKYAQTCGTSSQMKLLMPERIQYKGPDPPPEEWQVSEEPEVA